METCERTLLTFIGMMKKSYVIFMFSMKKRGGKVKECYTVANWVKEVICKRGGSGGSCVVRW